MFTLPPVELLEQACLLSFRQCGVRGLLAAAVAGSVLRAYGGGMPDRDGWMENDRRRRWRTSRCGEQKPDAWRDKEGRLEL